MKTQKIDPPEIIGKSLRDHFQSNTANNLDFLRIFAAFLVLFGHSFTLLLSNPSNIFPHDPITAKLLWKLPFFEGLPGIGLHIFFFISGLLVTRSFINHNGNIIKFCKARALRILPAYIICILFLALIAGPLLSTFGFYNYLKNPGVFTFIEQHLTFRGLPGLPNVFLTNPFGPSVNGSLWTIPLELQLYLWVLLLGCLTILKRRILFLVIFIYFILLYCGSGRSNIFFGTDFPRLWIFFFFGIFACLYADKITLSPRWALALVIPITITWKAGNPWFDVIGAAWFCYATLVFSFSRYFKFIDIGRIGDFSYGIYLYSFPVQQTLIYFFKGWMNGWLLVLFATAVTVPLAMLSWYFVEKPALQLKSARTSLQHLTQPV
jgi:peptidoglycan/LPS O-acetylase OafA/YrhL